MKITAALKQYLQAKGWLADPNATDDQVKQIVTARLVSGELDTGKLHELTDERAGLKGVLAGILGEALAPLTQELQAVKTMAHGLPAQMQSGPGGSQGNGSSQGGGSAGTAGTAGTQGGGAGNTSGGDGAGTEVSKQVQNLLIQAGILPSGGGGGGISPTRLLSRSAQAGWLQGADQVRVKSAIEGYDQSRSEARWPDNSKHYALRGKRLTAPSRQGPGMGKPLDHASKADQAIIGAYFKWALAANSPGEALPRGLHMTDHDMDLIKYALHELPWTGMIGGENGQGVDGAKLTEFQRKSLLDDSVSGGIYAAPLILDEQIIITPLLYGELFPWVEVINLTTGRRIEAFTFGRPTFTSGIPEGTAIPLFDTTNFISALDTTIQNAVGSMEIGNDFEEDSPANIGAMVISAYGEAALQWLDMVIAVGDGVTQPKGIFNTAGITVVGSTNGGAGPLAVSDLEGLMFGVNKAFRTSKGGRNIYLGNETSYRRFRAIPTAATWNTRAFGMDYGDYMTLGFPFKIQPNVPNNKIAYANMAYYRMYRRLGVQVRVEKMGKELALKNTTLIVVRMRYGGQMTLGGAAAVIIDAQS